MSNQAGSSLYTSFQMIFKQESLFRDKSLERFFNL